MKNFKDPLNLLSPGKNSLKKPPGTIEYNGIHVDVPFNVDVICYDGSQISRTSSTDFQIEFDPTKNYWINITGLNDIDSIKKIGQLFSIHHMDLEDIAHASKWSKIEERDGYLFSVLKMVYQKQGSMVYEHLSLVLKDNMLISFQETPEDVFDGIRNRLLSSTGRIRTMDSSYLYYCLLDSLIDEYFITINRISSAFSSIELKILEENCRETDGLYRLRKEIVHLISAFMPLKDAVVVFTRKDGNYIPGSLKAYYSDLVEHISQIESSLRGYKDMANSLHEMQTADLGNDMNKVMMTLTIFSAIFIPLSFLAGVFGMNFHYIPGLETRSSIYVFLASCVLIAFSMLVYFKSRKWF